MRTTLVRAMKRGQRCWRNVEHPESRELRTLPREIAGFRDILNCPLSSRTTPVPFLPIPRLHPGPVFGPRRGAACASTCLPPPRVELAVGVHERAHLEHAIDDHLRERTTFGTLDEATHQNYQRLLARHVYPTLGPKPVGSVHRDDLVRLFQRLLTGIGDGRKRGKATCRNLLAPIRQTYEWLITERQMATLTNPALRLGRLLRETLDKKKRVQPLMSAEQAALLGAARLHSPRYHFLFLVALTRRALRLSECFGVQWTDFDLDNRTVTVQRQFREGRLIDRTKKNKIHVVDLSREVCEEFRAHRARMRGDALAAGHPLSEFVFLTRLGEPIRLKSSFERRGFHRVVRLAGLHAPGHRPAPPPNLLLGHRRLVRRLALRLRTSRPRLRQDHGRLLLPLPPGSEAPHHGWTR